MGSMKNYIVEHIENCRDRLEPEFLEANAVDFVKWLNEQDTMLPLWQLFEVYTEEVKQDEFWEFCADDTNGE